MDWIIKILRDLECDIADLSEKMQLELLNEVGETDFIKALDELDTDADRKFSILLPIISSCRNTGMYDAYKFFKYPYWSENSSFSSADYYNPNYVEEYPEIAELFGKLLVEVEDWYTPDGYNYYEYEDILEEIEELAN